MTAFTLNSQNTFIDRTQFVVTPTAGLNTSAGPLSLVGGSYGGGQLQYCQYTYVSGFANAFTTTNAAAGATTLTLTNVTGVYAGSMLNVFDGAKDERVTVASLSGNVITLKAPLTYAHNSGTNIGNIPATVKQAVVHFIVAMIKERGQGGLMISNTGEPVEAGARSNSNMHDEIAAYDLLDDFRQYWGRQ
jgi:hypothetical protein